MSSAIRMLGLVVICSSARLMFAAAPLRVCADPNDLPYSNQQQQGFENKLAEMIAHDFETSVSYTWYPQRGKFFRRTLNSGLCDVVMSVPVGFDEAAVTHPYYRSTYVFVSRHDRNLHIVSFDDPQLRNLRIGVHVLAEGDDSLPPVHALVTRGIVRNLTGYSIFGNLTETNPAADLLEAVCRKDVDVAVAWGPLAGYFARQSNIALDITPIEGDRTNPGLPMSFDIGVGVRSGDKDLKSRLDIELKRREPEIRALLRSYGIPQLAFAKVAQAAGASLEE